MGKQLSVEILIIILHQGQIIGCGRGCVTAHIFLANKIVPGIALINGTVYIHDGSVYRKTAKS